jgi:hypothetical protein
MTPETKDLSRREFAVAAALAALSGVVITISSSACGSSYSSQPSPNPTPAPTPTPTGSTGDKVGEISNNHGHVAVITGAQLTAGGALALDIMGQATHTHTVQLSAGEVASIAGGQHVSKESTSNTGHSHTVTFN